MPKYINLIVDRENNNYRIWDYRLTTTLWNKIKTFPGMPDPTDEHVFLSGDPENPWKHVVENITLNGSTISPDDNGTAALGKLVKSIKIGSDTFTPSSSGVLTLTLPED